MVRTRERMTQEPPSAVNRCQNCFSAPPFVTIDSDKSPHSSSPQPRLIEEITAQLRLPLSTYPMSHLFRTTILQTTKMNRQTHPTTTITFPPDQTYVRSNLHDHGLREEFRNPRTTTLNHVRRNVHKPVLGNSHRWLVHQLQWQKNVENSGDKTDNDGSRASAHNDIDFFPRERGRFRKGKRFIPPENRFCGNLTFTNAAYQVEQIQHRHLPIYSLNTYCLDSMGLLAGTPSSFYFIPLSTRTDRSHRVF
ncbi:hypothetical protein ES332_D04G108400v1 [Gossypium tomentosum]|uniref:Uncharacterized protein n=2 Tax=Gossypium tomentosum TaxID=34277 RepID=A0A5D2LBR8_GOSTO|nr:hypothetical protein ES332_D04G108400v1 [Gossypium tomentosum]